MEINLKRHTFSIILTCWNSPTLYLLCTEHCYAHCYQQLAAVIKEITWWANSQKISCEFVLLFIGRVIKAIIQIIAVLTD